MPFPKKIEAYITELIYMLSIILQLICIVSTLSTTLGGNISKYIGDMTNTTKNPAQIDIYRMLRPTTAKLMYKF